MSMNITVTLRDTSQSSPSGIGSATIAGQPGSAVAGTEIVIEADSRYLVTSKLQAAFAAFVAAITT